MAPPSVFGGDPYGNRTRVTDVKGRCPRPLDEGTILIYLGSPNSP